MDDVEVADLKTLALSRPPLTEATLRELMTYQESLLEGCAVPERDLAAAHQAALAKTKLTAKELDLWSGVVREYCGKRWTARLLERRRAELEAKKAQGPLSASDEAKLAGILKDGAKASDLSAMRLRYGTSAFALLEAHEEALLALHERLRALSCF